ncbi:MAG TPA: asparagine synthase-related protein, partial [Chloroflexota bacterium]|nr:asparagine synthase-related protein [Chloroflexota bacterium]
LLHRSLWRRLERVPPRARTGVARALTGLAPGRWDRLARRLDAVLPARLPRDQFGDKIHKFADVLSLPDAESLYRALVSHWSDPATVVLDSTEAPTALTDPTRRASLPDDTDRMMYLDAISYLPDDILVKVDRAAMAVSLETRVPLLDADVVEFAWRLPRDLKIRGDQGKWLLRQVLYRHVPRELVDRPKMGFGVPIGEWLRGALRPWAEDLLAADTLRRQGFFEPATIRDRWTDHLSGTRDWKYQLWDVLMFQAWLESQET